MSMVRQSKRARSRVATTSSSLRYVAHHPLDALPLYSYPVQLGKRIAWKEIKDYLRDNGVKDVDTVHVFHRDRTGWVRVFGKADFDKAMSTSLNPLPFFTCH